MISRSIAQRTLRLASTAAPQRYITSPTHLRVSRTRTAIAQPNLRLHERRPYATATPPSSSPSNTPAGDALVEQLTELYATAYDEFEIASESTDANATYAEEDRKAAREELENVLKAYRKATEGGGETGDQVRRRVGQRVRELEAGVKGMEERALEHD